MFVLRLRRRNRLEGDPDQPRPAATATCSSSTRRGTAKIGAAAGVPTGKAGPATPDVAARGAGRANPSGDDRKLTALDGDDLNVGAATGHPPADAPIDRSNDRHRTGRPRHDGHRNRAHADAARGSGDHGISLMHFDLPPQKGGTVFLSAVFPIPFICLVRLSIYKE